MALLGGVRRSGGRSVKVATKLGDSGVTAPTRCDGEGAASECAAGQSDWSAESALGLEMLGCRY